MIKEIETKFHERIGCTQPWERKIEDDYNKHSSNTLKGITKKEVRPCSLLPQNTGHDVMDLNYRKAVSS